MDFIRILIKEIIRNKIKDTSELLKLRNDLTKKHKPKEIPSLIKIFLNANENERKILSKIIKVKPTRSISGVIPVAIMTKPYRCTNKERCIYCPGGLNSAFGNVPQSYTGNEPASMRAIRNNYDPYLQVFNRLEHYVILNHAIDKVELIIMGGNFNSLPKKYKEEFVKYSFKALNDFSKLFFNKGDFNYSKFIDFFELKKEFKDPLRTKLIQDRLKRLKGTCELKREQAKNENSKIRCVALCLENRPDYCKKKDIGEMLKLGCTRVEIGVQSIYNDVLKKVKRGHKVEDTIKAIRDLKDCGFKVSIHYMPGLPGVNKKRDLEGMKQLFKNENFKPDMLKIYPCMVSKGTKLHDLYKKKQFNPLTTEEAAELIVKFKRYIPVYCRVQRVQRDIASKFLEAGVNITNLRQYIHDNYNFNCNCIRCREIGHALNKDKNLKLGKIKILVKRYNASKGGEFFISAEDIKNNIIYGYCRLRFPFQILRGEIRKNSSLIRELHVYSSAISMGKTSKSSFQHRGLGKLLLKKAEEISKEHEKDKIIVISGVGAREYFKKLGYEREGPYMVKFVSKR